MGESSQEESAGELFALTPLDGAVSFGGTLAPDATRGLQERLETYEDIIDSEVGAASAAGLKVVVYIPENLRRS